MQRRCKQWCVGTRCANVRVYVWQAPASASNVHARVRVCRSPWWLQTDKKREVSESEALAWAAEHRLECVELAVAALARVSFALAIVHFIPL